MVQEEEVVEKVGNRSHDDLDVLHWEVQNYKKYEGKKSLK